MLIKEIRIFFALSLLILFAFVPSFCADSQMAADNAGCPANITVTDANGTFCFSNLAPGIYNLTAHRLILGAMHYMGEACVAVPGNESNATIKVTRADDAQFAALQNVSVNLTPGNYSITGQVMGANRPGAEPREIPYEETEVKITAAE
ncbi:MAG: hypothetical protein A4E49_00890 [Methanosaeta sp. PtaU1.Bin112]|nr:MAG: hypothetical protein A4E49_00890 [Methanosaeta sp. PtaU1.Bin112]